MKNTNTSTTPIAAAAFPETHKNFGVPLSDLQPLAGQWGLFNRDEDLKTINEIATRFDSNLVEVLTVVRTPTGKFVVLDGNNRYMGMCQYAVNNRINPAAFLVRVDFLDESEFTGPDQIRVFYDHIRQSRRVLHNIRSTLSTRWPGTGWGQHLPAGAMVRSTSAKGFLLATNILKARAMADNILTALAGCGSATDAINAKFPAISQDRMVQMLDHPKAAESALAVREWFRHVAKPKRAFDNANSLVFPILVMESGVTDFRPKDRLYRPFSDGRLKGKLPTGRDNLYTTVGSLLQVANAGTWSQDITILGVTSLGRF